MFNIGPLELVVILLIALVVVGPNRLPEVGRSIGKGLREFRKVQEELRDSINLNLDEPATPKPVPKPHVPRPVDRQRTEEVAAAPPSSATEENATPPTTSAPIADGPASSEPDPVRAPSPDGQADPPGER